MVIYLCNEVPPLHDVRSRWAPLSVSFVDAAYELVFHSFCSLAVFFAFAPFFFSSRRRHTRYWRDWSSDECSSDLGRAAAIAAPRAGRTHPDRCAVACRLDLE